MGSRICACVCVCARVRE
uniref:Uncharacterized protein n=1 Tax=Anopheles albimanus TaxID=7167 RepID=A0A182FYC0_ANOAL